MPRRKSTSKQPTKHVRSTNQAKLLVTAGASSTSSSSSSNRSSGANVISFNYNDASLSAEIYWLAMLASCNFSLRSADHIGDTLRQIFPDSKIALAGFNLSRSSASYMIGEGLAPCFKKVITDDVKKSNLPMGKLIALAQDGPNVNKTILNELQQMIKDDYPQFCWFC